tara:strand:+ start:543 stop:755 length:213 start_codon:yes stop_codon:yes gene_type:complete
MLHQGQDAMELKDYGLNHSLSGVMVPLGKMLLNPLGWIIEHSGNTSEIILMRMSSRNAKRKTHKIKAIAN